VTIHLEDFFFTSKVVWLVKYIVGGQGGRALPQRDGGSADYAVVSLSGKKA
jgi:hypothetical protein